MLLSRSAEHLYWMSRYLERAEHTARVLDVNLTLRLDDLPGVPTGRRWQRLLTCLHMPIPPDGVDDPYALTHAVAFDPVNSNSIASCVGAARDNARNVRELISSEMWEHVNRLYLSLRGAHVDGMWNDQPHDFFVNVKNAVHTFQGISDSTMTQGEGWEFIRAGRALERAGEVAALLAVHFSTFGLNEAPGDHFFEWVGLLRSCTAFEMYCKVHTADVRPRRVAEFLLFNAEFPHSVAFSVGQLQAALGEISRRTTGVNSVRVQRLAGRLRAAVDYSSVDDIVQEGLQNYLAGLQRQCGQIHDAIYQTFIHYPIERQL